MRCDEMECIYAGWVYAAGGVVFVVSWRLVCKVYVCKRLAGAEWALVLRDLSIKLLVFNISVIGMMGL